LKRLCLINLLNIIYPNRGTICVEEKINNRTSYLSNKELNFKSYQEEIDVGGIFCDLDKAFDCVNHKILLSELEYYGITGKATFWFESYIKKSCQRVKITKADPNYNTLANRALR